MLNPPNPFVMRKLERIDFSETVNKREKYDRVSCSSISSSIGPDSAIHSRVLDSSVLIPN